MSKGRNVKKQDQEQDQGTTTSDGNPLAIAIRFWYNEVGDMQQEVYLSEEVKAIAATVLDEGNGDFGVYITNIHSPNVHFMLMATQEELQHLQDLEDSIG